LLSPRGQHPLRVIVFRNSFLMDSRFLFVRNGAKEGGLYGGALSDASITRILPEISNAAYVPGQGGGWNAFDVVGHGDVNGLG
jgi:hypothetical protein